MADELPAALVDEATSALVSLARLTLPPERWPAVGEAVQRMDDAAWVCDDKGVRAELKKLREAVIGVAPRPRPGDGVAPAVNPLSFRTTDYATRTPLRRISSILAGAAVLLATTLVLLVVVLAVGDDQSVGPAVTPTPTSEAAPPADPDPPQPPESDGGGWYGVGVALFVVAGIGIFAGMIWRRRIRARAPRVEHSSTRLQTVAAPEDLVDAAQRLVTVLEERRTG